MVLGANVEELTVVDVGEKVDHSLGVDADEVLEFVQEHGKGAVLDEGTGVVAVGTDGCLGAEEFADSLAGHDRGRQEEVGEAVND